MIDGFIQSKTEKILLPWNDRLLKAGLKPNLLLMVSFLFGLIACFCVAFQAYIPAIIFIILNRFFDSIAVNLKPINVSRMLDTLFFGSFIFFFSLGAVNTSMAAAFLLLSYLIRLACANNIIQKFNLIENSEIIIFMIVCCLFPQIFAAIAIFFAILCMVDAGKRFYDGVRG